MMKQTANVMRAVLIKKILDKASQDLSFLRARKSLGMISIVRVNRKERRVFMRHLISTVILALSVVMWTSWAWPAGQKDGTLEDVIEEEV